MEIIPEFSKSQLSPADFVKRLTVGFLLINLFVFTLTFMSLRQSRLQYDEQAGVTTRNLAQVLEQNIAGSFDKIDVALIAAAEKYEHQFARGGVDRKGLNIFLARLATRLPELDRLTVIDALGVITYCTSTSCATTGNMADRDIFMHLRDDPKPGLLIFRPMVSRITGKGVVILARRMSKVDGGFAGAVCGTIPEEHFLKLFASINVGPHGAIALRDLEQGLIARIPQPLGDGAAVGWKGVSPEFQELFKSGRISGTYKTRAPVDNTERMYTFRRISNYPLNVHVGLAVGDYLAHWRGEVVKISAAATLFFLLTLFTALMIFRDWKRMMAAVQALRDTQYSVDHAAVPIFWLQEGSRFCYANNACGYLGYSRDELLKMTVYDIDPLFSKEGAAKFLETLREKGSMTFESIHKTRSGDLGVCRT